MKKEFIDLGDFLEQRNPLAFKDEHKHIMYFKDYEAAYLEMMKRVFEAGPKMVDLVLLCMETYDMHKADAERFVARWHCFGISEDTVLTNWNFGDDAGEQSRLIQTLRCIAQGMHSLACTKFNNDMFLSAFYKYTSRNRQ